MNILKPRIIIESPNITGHLDSSTGECNIVQIFSNWISKLMNKEIQNTFQIIPELQELMCAQGELTEKDYDVLKFLPNN